MKDKNTFRDAFNLFVGKKIGEGIHRSVFECKVRKDLVVKVEHNDDHRFFANVIEEKFWSDFSFDKSIAKWLAPCEFLSPDGRLLLQKKCEPITGNFKLPNKLPEFLTDIKIDNFGILNKKLVCFDYAFTIVNVSLRMRKVDFIDR